MRKILENIYNDMINIYEELLLLSSYEQEVYLDNLKGQIDKLRELNV